MGSVPSYFSKCVKSRVEGMTLTNTLPPVGPILFHSFPGDEFRRMTKLASVLPYISVDRDEDQDQVRVTGKYFLDAIVGPHVRVPSARGASTHDT